jgi:hypothetical protein
MNDDRQSKSAAMRAKSHMPDTTFYEKIIPALLIFLGILMFVLIVFAFAVIFGYIRI